ncbi:NAD(P)/FAD-dependent oxidoreductase [Pasteuria penetrans]|uniref:NAD(P)/FAD-dependent oxidoreductase n=1 Tax=Pasteuria penetrans TaxID=86005 RepID=UPI000FB4AFE8|nr:NAD(P)/FAD-dependent oxidoreductase [Pasteuria penetrans]
MAIEKNMHASKDITIIGGGPTGLFTSFYAGMRDASTRLIESLPQLGGQLTALYPEKYIYDVAGLPKIRAKELVRSLIEQADRFQPEYCLEETVIGLEKPSESLYLLRTERNVYPTKTVIITAGCGAFTPQKIHLMEATRFEGKNLYYSVLEPSVFTGKHVLIAGGGDSAVDWTLMLAPLAKQVTLVHRRNQFRAHERSVQELRSLPSVQILTPYEIKKLQGETEIEQVVLSCKENDSSPVLPVDAVIAAFGFKSSLGPIANFGLTLKGNSISVNQKMETNLPGVYAAGDITTYPGKIKLIATGFGEAPIAVSHAKKHIHPQTRLQPGHSSERSFV